MKTNKYLYRVSLMMGFAALFTLSSCGDDDDSADTYKNTKPMRVSKITEYYTHNSDNVRGIYNFLYNREGLLEEIISSKGGAWTFSYDINKIIRGGRTYVLNNGKVVKMYFRISDVEVVEYYYDYDCNGYMISEEINSRDHKSHVKKFIWENGNLTKCTEYKDGKVRTYYISYSKIPWPKNWSHYPLIYADSYFEELFPHPFGIWGKTPKNLPSRNEMYDDGGRLDSYSCTIDYTIKDDLITRMAISNIPPSDYLFTRNCDIEWEEIPAK